MTVAASSGSGNIAGATVVAQNVMSAGADDTCAILAGGTVECWGNGYLGQLGNNGVRPSSTPVQVVGLSGATQVASTQLSNCTLASGQVECWGDGANGQLGNGSLMNRAEPVSVIGITNATQISGGADSVCALLATGTVDCWGYDTFGQLGDGGTTQWILPWQ